MYMYIYMCGLKNNSYSKFPLYTCVNKKVGIYW